MGGGSTQPEKTIEPKCSGQETAAVPVKPMLSRQLTSQSFTDAAAITGHFARS